MITVEDQVKALSALHGMSDAEQRRAAQAERDEASFAERCRAQRHHEVLCLVLKAWIEHDCAVMRANPDGPAFRSKVYTDDLVEAARTAANTAYPPPKAEEP